MAAISNWLRHKLNFWNCSCVKKSSPNRLSTPLGPVSLLLRPQFKRWTTKLQYRIKRVRWRGSLGLHVHLCIWISWQDLMRLPWSALGINDITFCAHVPASATCTQSGILVGLRHRLFSSAQYGALSALDTCATLQNSLCLYVFFCFVFFAVRARVYDRTRYISIWKIALHANFASYQSSIDHTVSWVAPADEERHHVGERYCNWRNKLESATVKGSMV